MTLINGVATCAVCYETFDLGHHYDFHVANCRSKRRLYTRMDPQKKKHTVELMENYIREYIPGFLIGYGEME